MEIKIRKLMNKVRKNWALCQIIIIVLVIICIAGSNKQNFHVDEYYTYGLANSTEGAFIKLPEGEADPVQIFNNYFIVKSGNQFNYSNVWKNQIEDVHPPLYYVLIHTICSIFTNTFNKWIGIGLNVIFLIACIMLLYKLALRLFKGQKNRAMLTCILFAVAPGTISATLFIRMYMMVMVIVMAITLLHINNLEVEQLNRKFYIKLFIITVIGVLTHYYFILYLVFLCATFCIFLLSNKRWREIVTYMGTMFLSAIVAIICFPAMLLHIFGGYQGSASFNNLTASNDYLKRLNQFVNMIDTGMLGKMFFAILIGAIVILIMKSQFEDRDKIYNMKNIIKWDWIVAIVPTVGYIVLVAKIAVHITSRYIHPIYPIAILGVIGMLSWMLNKFTSLKVQNYLLCIIIGYMITSSYQNYKLENLYQDNRQYIEIAQEYKDKKCIYIYQSTWMSMPNYYELIQYNNVEFIGVDDLYKESRKFSGEKIVYLYKKLNQEEVLKWIVEKSEGISKWSKLYSNGYADVYYLD